MLMTQNVVNKLMTQMQLLCLWLKKYSQDQSLTSGVVILAGIATLLCAAVHLFCRSRISFWSSDILASSVLSLLWAFALVHKAHPAVIFHIICFLIWFNSRKDKSFFWNFKETNIIILINTKGKVTFQKSIIFWDDNSLLPERELKRYFWYIYVIYSINFTLQT